MLAQGIYPDLSNKDYHADAALSRTGIMCFEESAYKFWANYVSVMKPEHKPTDAMILGSAFHTLILEPHLFDDIYIMEPEKLLLKDVGRIMYEKYKDLLTFLENSKHEVISNKNWKTLEEMADSLRNHKEAWELIEGAIYERSYFWKDESSGLMVKSRPDLLHKNMIVDLKTCTSASSHAYQRSMVDGGYHIQGAMVRDALRKLENRDVSNVINVCVETKYPYAIGIKIISEHALNYGENEYKKALLEIKQCQTSSCWPTYEIETVDLPHWYE